MSYLNGSAPRPLWITCAALSVPVLMAAIYGVATPETIQWMWSEQGPLELSHVVIPLIVMSVGIATLSRKGRVDTLGTARLGWLAAAIGGLAILCGIIAGEEASWGQHLFGWSTPEAWNQVNDQQETNLHNITSWADQKPRAIIEAGVIVCGILWPLMMRFTRIRVGQLGELLLPPASVLPIALCAEAVRLLERVPASLGMRGWAAFPRPSELQELYFYTFFAICMFAWRDRYLLGLRESQDELRSTRPLHRPIPLERHAA